MICSIIVWNSFFPIPVTLNPPEVIGPVPEGIRVNLYITGGEVTGRKVRGKLRPVGGDWLTIRRDGVAILTCTSQLKLMMGI